MNQSQWVSLLKMAGLFFVCILIGELVGTIIKWSLHN